MVCFLIEWFYMFPVKDQILGSPSDFFGRENNSMLLFVFTFSYFELHMYKTH
jgi:hypothetical protein